MKIKSLYISSFEKGAGTIFVCLGMMHLLKKKYYRVGFFRPIIKHDIQNDPHIQLLFNHFSLSQDPQSSYGFTLKKFRELSSQNKNSLILQELIIKIKKLEKEFDFILISGLNREEISVNLDFDINLEISKNLDSPFLSIINAKKKSNTEILEALRVDKNSIKDEGVQYFGTFINRVDHSNFLSLTSLLNKNSIVSNFYILPQIDALESISISDIQKKLKAKLLFGETKNLNRQVINTKIASMTLDNFIKRVEEGDLIIVPGDRSDIIVGSLVAVHAKSTPTIAGVLLTGALKPKKAIAKLLHGFDNLSIPILSVDTDTYKSAMNVSQVKPTIEAKSYTKIAIALGAFCKYINKSEITDQLHMDSTSIMTPLMFQYKLFEKARKNKKNIVLAESSDSRILRAAENLLNCQAVDITLIGNKKDIYHKAKLLGLDIQQATIINPQTSKLTENFIETLYNLRKHKGMTLELAKEIMRHNENYFATMLVHLGYVDGMVSGAIHTTAQTVRPAFEIIKTKPNTSIISSLFFMCLDTKVLVYADCAINQSPNSEELAQIAISSAQSALNFEIKPKIAMLSYSSGESGSGEEVEEVREATQIIKKRVPSLQVEGPIQYDAAIDKGVAKTKLPDSLVAGNATVLIFPDLNTGNNTYKAVQRSSGAVAIGPILQGLNKPVNDLSRGARVTDIINTILITAIQAQSS